MTKGDKQETWDIYAGMAKTLEIEQWLEIRRQAASSIDPETAEVDWDYAQTFDPYGIDDNLPDELWQVGREYFSRAPFSHIWVWFGDLPEETSKKLLEKHESKLMFPAGLFVERPKEA